MIKWIKSQKDFSLTLKRFYWAQAILFSIATSGYENAYFSNLSLTSQPFHNPKRSFVSNLSPKCSNFNSSINKNKALRFSNLSSTNVLEWTIRWPFSRYSKLWKTHHSTKHPTKTFLSCSTKFIAKSLTICFYSWLQSRKKLPKTTK